MSLVHLFCAITIIMAQEKHDPYSPAHDTSYPFKKSFQINYEGGFYQHPIYLKLNRFFNDSIFYTTDGSIPNHQSSLFQDSIFLGYLYEKENILSKIPSSPDEFWEEPKSMVDKAHILRFQAFREGQPIGETISHTYFIDSLSLDKYHLPIISLITDERHFFSHEDGIYVPGITYNPLNPLLSGNYFQRGENWEKPIHIEYYNQEKELGFAQNAGVRIHGGVTRKRPQKTLRLYARSEYGSSKFDYPLLPNRSQNSYKRILLRSTMSAWNNGIISDVLAHQMIKESGLDYQEYQPVIVFLNGEYWGIHTLRDRIDHRYISYVHGIDKDSVDMIEGLGAQTVSGDNENYLALIEFISQNDISATHNYQYLCTQMDMENYMDYMIAQIYFKNYDWPGNNIKVWKSQREGAKWKWIFYDIDAGFGDMNYSMFEHLNNTDPSIIWPNPPKSTFLFRQLLTNDHFVHDFIQRFEAMMHRSFEKNKALTIYETIKTQYEPSIPMHVERWNFPESTSQWEFVLESDLKDFISRRPCQIENQIASVFQISEFKGTCELPLTALESGPILLAPNPCSDYSFLYNQSPENIQGRLEIYNMSGQKVYTQEEIIIESHSKVFLPLHQLPSQAYLLMIYHQGQIMKWKFLINK